MTSMNTYNYNNLEQSDNQGTDFKYACIITYNILGESGDALVSIKPQAAAKNK